MRTIVMAYETRYKNSFNALPPEVQEFAGQDLTNVKLSDFVDWIEANRLHKRYSVTKVCKKAGLSQHTYYKELRQKVPSDEAIKAIAQVFDVDPAPLLKQELPPSIDERMKVMYLPDKHNEKAPEEYKDGITLAERDRGMSVRRSRQIGSYCLEVLNDLYVDTIDLYGVPVKGRIRSTMRNVVIVEDDQGHRHVVHKENLGEHERFHVCLDIPRVYDREEIEKRKQRPVRREGTKDD